MKNKYLPKLIKIYEELVSILVDIAEDPDMDANSLRKLSKLTDDWVETCVSLHPRTPSKVLEKMLALHSPVGGVDEEWRIHIVGNPALRLKVLKEAIEQDPSLHVREAALTALAKRMARSPKASAKELLKVYREIERSKSLSKGMRQKVAMQALLKHPGFPKDKVKRRT